VALCGSVLLRLEYLVEGLASLPRWRGGIYQNSESWSTNAASGFSRYYDFAEQIPTLQHGIKDFLLDAGQWLGSI
jgi:hypothetical protein